MEPNEESLQMLVGMGFSNLTEIKRALTLSKNDVNEAVAILTNEQPGLGFETGDDVMETKEVVRSNSGKSKVESTDQAPPSYDEAVEPEDDAKYSSRSSMEADTEDDMNSTKEFPATNLYELESRVFTDQWSIPYKKEESLGKCLIASTRFAEENLVDSDENCKRFVSRCMPEAIRKLMVSHAVQRWGAEIQEGIYVMLQLTVDLIAATLKHKPVPVDLLGVLTMILNPETEFHYKNRSKHWDRLYWEERLGSAFASSPPFSTYRDPYGWLVNLINRFGEKGGFEELKKRALEPSEELDPIIVASLLQPLGVCSDYLNTVRVSSILGPVSKRTLKYVRELAESDLKQKKAGCISDILSTMKVLCLNFWAEDVKEVDDLRLDIALRMLKSPHFNAKMNSLKEITKLIEDCGTRNNRTAIQEDVILDWLVEKKVLSIALEGNIDQSQYCERLKGVVVFLGTKLSLEELTGIWNMQNDQPLTVVENIHSIMSAAAVKFTSDQMEHLFCLIQKAWTGENNRIQEKLLSLIGRIGREARNSKTTCKMLELLWDLAHLPGIPTPHLQHALDEQLAILSDSFTVNMPVKQKYIGKCVGDIKKGFLVVPALRQLHSITRDITKQSYTKDKGLPQELNRNYDIMKLTTQSLLKYHKTAVASLDGQQLSPKTSLEGRYTHKEYVDVHLRFLAFILQEGALYLPWHRAREIWDCLVANPDACEMDIETCFEWFSDGLTDLDTETQMQLFKEKLLKLDPTLLSTTGFECVKMFFESININSHSLKKMAAGLVVEKLDLYGLDFLWQIALETPSEAIADQAIKHLMKMCYSNLSQKLKKDPVALHNAFIAECYRRLELASITIGGTAMAIAVSQATKTLTAATVPAVAGIPCPSRAAKLLVIERLLKLAETYITTVEDQHLAPRTILPHGASYQGHPVTMQVVCDSQKYDFILVGHGNETLQSVRQRIAQRMRTSVDNIQIAANDRMLMSNKYPKLLRQLEFEDQQLLTVKQLGIVSRIDESNFTSRQTYMTDVERSLPGVVMAAGGQVFEMLYQLAEMEGSRLTERVRNLLMLIPTDPTVQEALDSICRQTEGTSVDWGDRNNSPKETSKATLDSLFKTNSQSMSAFRLLYNLEVLSSRLVPSLQEDKATQISAQTFRENFLNAGGLSLVISVLQKDSIPQDMDEETRRGCYLICLHLARFLLCGETTTDLMESDLSMTESQADTSIDSASGGLSSSFGTSPRKMSIVERMSSVEASGDVAYREGTSTAIAVIQTMSTSDFSSMIGCLMRVCWAAAAGQLRLASSTNQIKDAPSGGNGMGINRLSRHSSGGSSSSESVVQSLHSGVCLLATHVSTKDAMIAREALELLVACLQLRTHNLSSFYNMSAMSDFVIDILLACPHSDVRTAAMEQFYTLSVTSVDTEIVCTLHPRHFLLQVLLRIPVPLWTSSCLVRGSNQRILSQCSQYFELRCRLLEQLTLEDQRFLNINPMSMLKDEIDWLNNFEPCDSEESSLSQTDNVVIAGHLQLAKTLVTCEGVDKIKIGKQLIDKLLNDYLFPASRRILDSSSNPDKLDPQADYNPKISGRESRTAAFDLLIILSEDCPENLRLISNQLMNMHHQQDPAIAKEWDYLPPVDGRSPCKYVGLRNGGATCYMNSVIQQLYMTPGIREGLLRDSNGEVDEDSVFYQIQMVLGHLMESRLQYYEPERFWKVFKLWGQPVNIREQQDAFEFFTNLTDQLDEYLKKNKLNQVFKKKFQGFFSDQKICEDCPHRYEREEEFFALNLTVKSHNLESSLDQFVRGELLEGDNAYFCEKCNEKRNTIKRMCIKTLPPVLVIQLKRFDYDWEAGRALKFDDYFKFPWVLDMEPYTVKGIARQESRQAEESPATTPLEGTKDRVSEDLYHLVGIIVHSGQANAGHYYSFIKDRWGTTFNNPTKGRWFKFNDTLVDEFDMSDPALEAECFGGSYKPKIYEPSAYSSDTRLRYWNAYMLFYERLEGTITPVGSSCKIAGDGNRVTLLTQDSEGEIHVLEPISSPELSPHHDGDRLSELTALVRKGEHRGMFVDRMPPDIQRVIRDNNLQFLRNRAIYDADYFSFVRNLVSCNVPFTVSECYDSCAVTSLQLAFQFLFNNYFKTKKKLRIDLGDWLSTIAQLVGNSKEASMWSLSFMAGLQGQTYIKQFLLECPMREVRIAFTRIVQNIVQTFVQLSSSTVSCITPLDNLIEYVLSLLDKEVPDHCKTCQQYFWLLSCYLDMDIECCKHLFAKLAVRRIITFLLGQHNAQNEEDVQTRRWTSLQTREFGYLHTMLAVMVLYCDVSKFRTTDQADYPERTRRRIISIKKLLVMPADMQQILFGTEGIKYIREVVLMFREVPGATETLMDMLLHCSFCNEPFTLSVMMMIHGQVSSAPTNELKQILILLLELLMMEDPLQRMRLKLAVEGNDSNGLLEIIRDCTSSDSRRSYQCIKFLVHLSNTCPLAKEYLMTISGRWQWAVNWLKKKMSEHYWTPQNISNESSSGRSFQRTMSAQDTLAEATALLDELNTRDDEDDDNDENEYIEGDSNTKMEINGSSEGSEVNGNEDSSESSKTLVQDDVGDLDDIDA